MILDELGYVPFDKTGADLLFGFISQRYERRSLVVTTNLPFARWSEVFLNATAAAAVIDRIVHHATVLTTAGDSFRLKAATRNHASRMRHRRCHANSARRNLASRRSAPSGHVATTTTTQKWGSLFKWPKGPFSACHSQPARQSAYPSPSGGMIPPCVNDAFR